MTFSPDPELLARVLRRQQYVLGPRAVEARPTWRSHAVAGGLHLSAHPDLEVTTVSEGAVTLSALGYVLDPDSPGSSNAQVLGRLASAVAAGGDLLRLLRPLGGRYVLLVEDGGRLWLVGDPAGSLQLFYATGRGPGSAEAELWCAAQPDLLADLLGLEEDPEAVDFIRWMSSRLSEHFFPADSSPYSEVRRLLPNHYLDLVGREVRRYWPSEPLPERTPQDIARPVADRLRGLLAAGAARFDLSIGISAGLDSRLLLAASRDVLDRVVFYTGQSPDRGPRHPDVALPREMLGRIGATHHVIPNRGDVHPDFAEVFRRSVPFPHMHRAAALQSQLGFYRLERVAVLGNVSEAARGRYRLRAVKSPPPEGLTPAYFARLGQMQHPFAVRQYERWLDGLGETHGYHVLDILYWDSRVGSWFPQNVSEFLVAWQDVFLPYNDRELLEDLLSATRSAGSAPVEAYAAVVQAAWPELGKYPVNPVSLPARLRRSAFVRLRGLKRALLGG